MTYYKKLSEISIYQFTLLSVLKSLEYMIVDYRCFSKKEIVFYLNKNASKVESALEEMFAAFDELSYDKKVLAKIKLRSLIDSQIEDRDTVIMMLELYKETYDPKYLNILNDIRGFSYDFYMDEETQLKKIEVAIKHLTNKINLGESKFKEKYNIKKNEEEQKEDSEDSLYTELDNQAVTLSSNLELGYSIDIKETNVVRWFNYNKSNKERAEYFEQLNN